MSTPARKKQIVVPFIGFVRTTELDATDQRAALKGTAVEKHHIFNR